MKILLLSQSYKPVLGGLQTVTHVLAKELILRGHKVKVVTNLYPRSLSKRENFEGVDIARWLFLVPSWEYLWNNRIDLFLAALIYYPLTMLKLDKMFKAFKPDVINIHFPDAQIPFILRLRKRYCFRLVVSLHGDEVERWSEGGTPSKGDKKFKAFKRILEISDLVTACSQSLLRQASQLSPEIKKKGIVIYNGIDYERFQKINLETSLPFPYILAYGRFIYKKGFDLLLLAFSRILMEFPNIKLVLAGTGKEDLQGYAKKIGVILKVQFWGRATPQEVAGLLQKCKFLVIPSRQEPFGIVALEGIAAKKPIVATRVGGLVEILSGLDNQVLFVDPSINSLAWGLKQMMKRTSRISPLNFNNEKHLSVFTWDKMVDKYEISYRVSD